MRPLREGFCLGFLISASTLAALKELRQAAAQRDCNLWAALMSGCLIHRGVWAVPYLAGWIHWHGAQQMNRFEAWFRVTNKGTVHLGIQCKWTVCCQQMEALGWAEQRGQMGELQSVKLKETTVAATAVTAC